MADLQKRQTGYILKNAENIMDLLNSQNCHNSEIKQISEFLSSTNASELIRKTFECSQCDKNFSSKTALYSHKARYHKRSSNEKDFKCKKCDDSFENETNLAIHNYRFHRASL